MGRDNQPRARQAAQLARKADARKADTARVLIVCEGSKTEPHYFDEIRRKYRLPSANLQVHPSRAGTDPLTVVRYAQELLVEGSRRLHVEPLTFEHVFAVFDRDDHATYFQALEEARKLDNKHRNDLKKPVRFAAVASVPCFELWLLLHFQDQHGHIHRDDVCASLRKYLPGYAKGQGGHYAATVRNLDQARQRATLLAQQTSALHGTDPYTGVHELVDFLHTLREP